MSGNHNRILQVDLSSGKHKEIRLDSDYWLDYVGGSTLAARLLADSGGLTADPLSPANPLLVMTGPMVGATFPGSSRFVMCARSPLTGIWGESASGGFFGAALKKAGFDGIVFLGKSDRPSYLVVENGRAQLINGCRRPLGSGHLRMHRQIKAAPKRWAAGAGTRHWAGRRTPGKVCGRGQ